VVKAILVCVCVALAVGLVGQAIGIWDYSDFGRLILHSSPEITGQHGETISNATDGEWDFGDAVVNAAVGRTATLVVAASNSSSLAKKQADYVCDGTDDEAEINAAIDALSSSGGLVLLLEGTYYINNSISLADGDDNITITGQGCGTVLKIPDNHSQTFYVISAVGSADTLTNIHIRDLQIDGNKDNVASSTQWYVGVDFNKVKRASIENVYLMDGKGYSGDGYAIWLREAYNVTISNCHVEGWDEVPVEFRLVDRVVVSNNFLEGRFELYETADNITIEGNVLHNIEIDAGTDVAAQADSINQLQISNNFFYTDEDRASGFYLVHLRSAERALVSGNQFYINGANWSGVGGNYGDHHEIIGNSFYLLSSAISGVSNTFKYSNIVGNYFYHAAQNHGITISAGSYNNIANNYSYNVDPTSYATSLVRLTGTADNNFIRNNFVYNGGDCIYVATDGNEITGNQIRGKFNRGINVSGDNNRFVDNYISGTIWVSEIDDSGSGNLFGKYLHDARTTAQGTSTGTITVLSGSTNNANIDGWAPIYHPTIGDTIWVPYMLDPTP